jgi:hypothetical protein
VIKDYRQIKERDFNETYALVVRSDISRILLAVAAVKNYQIRQFDVKTVFLYDQMNRVLYIAQSKEFEKDDVKKNVYQLNTSLYDLM